MIRPGIFLLSTALLAAGPQSGLPEPPDRVFAVSRDLPSLVAAERAFASASRQHGIREAFLSYLAEGCVIFRPGPVDGRKWFQDREPSTGTLLWEPDFARVSADGGFGMTSGPWEFRAEPGAEPAHGHYVSVWRRNDEGEWRAVADIGVNHAEGRNARMSGVTADGPDAPLDDTGRKQALSGMLEADRLFIEGGLTAVLAERAGKEIRLYRDDHMPMIGLAAARRYAEGAGEEGTPEPMGGGVSAAGDLGYTYGVSRKDAGAAASAAYLRVWSHGPQGWQLAMDVTVPLPPPADP